MLPHHHTQTVFVTLDRARCQACWACVAACPRDVIDKIDLFGHRHAHLVRAENCRGCLKCVRTCPSGALHPREKQHEKEHAPLLG